MTAAAEGMTGTTVRRTGSGIQLSRSFAARPSTVFRALSERDHLMRWWGPPTCRVVECSIDFRVGGLWHYRLLSPDGSEHWSRAIYREIVPDERIVYVETGSDAAGRVVNDRPASVATLSLIPTAQGTRLEVSLVFVSPTERDRAADGGVIAGFSTALDQLDPLLTQLEPSRKEARHVL